MIRKSIVTLITLCSVMSLSSTGHMTGGQRNRVPKPRVSPAAGRWNTFTSPDRDFTLDFPGTPKRVPDEQGPVTIIRSYGLTTKDGMRFAVNFQDIGGDPQSRQNNEFARDHEELVTAAAREQGRRVVQVHRLAKNVIEIEYRMRSEDSNDDISYVERTILRRGRVYSVSCGSVVGGREVDRSACRRFFNSMRFIK